MTQTPKTLTTAEHAHLLGLQQAVDAAMRERDVFVRFLASQHEVTPDGWNLDLGTGAWVAKETPGE